MIILDTPRLLRYNRTMAYLEKENQPQPIGETFDNEAPTDNGYIALPLSMQLCDGTKILTMLPGEFSFISAGSAQVDERSHRISLDTNDTKQDIPRTLKDLRERPAIMRVLRGIGEHAARMADGYVMDFRWVQKIIYDDRGLDEGIGSAEFMQRQDDYETVLPLGVIFLDDDKTLYVGAPEVRNEALQLASWVDAVAWKIGVWKDDTTTAQPRRALNEWPNAID